MTTLSKSVRIALIVLLVVLLAGLMSACGGSGNGVEKAVSGAVNDGIDSQTGNDGIEKDAQGNCWFTGGLVKTPAECPAVQ